jgi:multicomponent Na+:H+ antiporter subunit F
MNLIWTLAEILLLVSLTLVALRLIRGPSLADRAVASDQIALRVVGLVAVYSMKSNQPFLIDLSIVTALVGFLTLAVIAIYIERGLRGKTRMERGDLG